MGIFLASKCCVSAGLSRYDCRFFRDVKLCRESHKMFSGTHDPNILDGTKIPERVLTLCYVEYFCRTIMGFDIVVVTLEAEAASESVWH
jgi:hypothetical protein